MTSNSGEIESLYKQLSDEPDSKELLERLLSKCLTPEWIADSRRIECAAAYVRHYPRSYFSRCPFVHVSPEDSLDGFHQVETEWLSHLKASPDDAELARGFALFVGESDPQRALDALSAVETTNQHDAELYIDIARIARSPAHRLEALLRACELGAYKQDLLAWIAPTALDVGDLDRAEQAGRDLLELAATVRKTHGDRLDWAARGAERWAKAQAVSSTRQEAREIVDAISAHTNHKHWGHTVLGVVAIRRGDIDSAVEHLRESTEIVGSPRISSYGPSFRLARELVAHERWDSVADFLDACCLFWDRAEMRVWRIELSNHRVPEFPDQ